MTVLLLLSPVALAQEVDHFVVLKPTAVLHATQDDAGWRFYESARIAARQEQNGVLHTMRVVKKQDDWLLVENIPGEALNSQCQSSLWSLSTMRLRFWVRSSDLGVATTKPVALKYADGTAITLARGQGATPKGSKHLISLGVMWMQLTLPDDALGQEFEAPVMFDDPETKDIVLVGGPVPDLIFDRTNRVRSNAGASLIKSAHTKVKKGNEWLVTIRDSCAELVVRAKKASLSKTHDGEEVAMISGMLPSEGTSVRAGATVYWADRSRAGEVVGDPLLVQGSLTRSDDRWCTNYDLVSFRDSKLLPPFDQALKICFDAKDVTIGKAP